MLRVILALIMSAVTSSAVTYYIDFDAGDDTAAGTATNTAWKTIPGTRTTNNSGWLRSEWGGSTITSAAKTPTNTTFILKAGTTYNVSDGGHVWISTEYYTDTATSYDSILFQRSSTWGSGSIVFDATSMTNDIAVILNQIDGVTLDGNGTDGIIVKLGNYNGIQVKEKAGDSAAVNYVHIKDIFCQTNAQLVATDAQGAAFAGIAVRRGNYVNIESCKIDGGQQYHQGVLLGETDYAVVNATVSSCEAYNLKGDPLGTDDAGIGFKSYNSQCTWSNVNSHGNQKGFDVGQEGSGDLSMNITNIIINSIISTNYTGINSPGTSQTPYTGDIKLYIINSLITDNTYQGYRTYAGPHESVVVHCVFDNNGSTPPSGTYSGHIQYSADTLTESAPMLLHVYNCIFSRAFEMTYLVFNFQNVTNDLTFDLNYNSYQQSTNSETFFKWSVNAGSDPYYPFVYGVDGPGKTTGRYYTTYDGTTNAPSGPSLGHYQQDANSFGTGCDNTNLPSFTDLDNQDFTLTSSFNGASLSGKSWYLPVMSTDRAGNPRPNWDLGAYEYAVWPEVADSPPGRMWIGAP